jgi:hypothetical protein
MENWLTAICMPDKLALFFQIAFIFPFAFLLLPCPNIGFVFSNRFHFSFLPFYFCLILNWVRFFNLVFRPPENLGAK